MYQIPDFQNGHATHAVYMTIHCVMQQLQKGLLKKWNESVPQTARHIAIAHFLLLHSDKEPPPPSQLFHHQQRQPKSQTLAFLRRALSKYAQDANRYCCIYKSKVSEQKCPVPHLFCHLSHATNALTLGNSCQGRHAKQQDHGGLCGPQCSVPTESDHNGSVYWSENQ